MELENVWVPEMVKGLACCPCFRTSSLFSPNSRPCLIIWVGLVVWSNIVLWSIDQIVPSAYNCTDMKKDRKRFFLGEIKKAHAILPGSRLLEKVISWWWKAYLLSIPCPNSLLVSCCSQTLWLVSALLGGIPRWEANFSLFIFSPFNKLTVSWLMVA